VVVVDSLVLPTGADTDVGGKPTKSADVDEVGRWGEEDTPPYILRDRMIRDDGVVEELWKSPAIVEHKALLQLGGKSVHETVVLLIGLNLLWSILCQMVEELRVAMLGPSALL
jgi:hypothetical protein